MARSRGPRVLGCIRARLRGRHFGSRTAFKRAQKRAGRVCARKY